MILYVFCLDEDFIIVPCVDEKCILILVRDDYVRELDIRAQVTMNSDGAQVYQLLFIVTCSLSPIT
jgi:hypothetical protein